MAFSVYSRVGLIQKALSGAPADEMAEEYELHNKRYARYFTFFYEAIFRDKYYVMGDYDTMTIAFLMDTALYYLAAVIPVYRWSSERLGLPPYYQDGSEIAFYPMRFYNRRLVAIAKRKKGARDLRKSQRGPAPRVRRLLRARRELGHARARPPALGEGGVRERLVLCRQAGRHRRAGPATCRRSGRRFGRPRARSQEAAPADGA